MEIERLEADGQETAGMHWTEEQRGAEIARDKAKGGEVQEEEEEDQEASDMELCLTESAWSGASSPSSSSRRSNSTFLAHPQQLAVGDHVRDMGRAENTK
eukprot:104767-Hanusia_phi.AAC.1